MPIQTMEERIKYHFTPQAVVESRWKEQKYVPEIMTVDGNFILGPPESSHEAAMAIAEDMAKRMTEAMLITCRQFTRTLPKAKE